MAVPKELRAGTRNIDETRRALQRIHTYLRAMAGVDVPYTNVLSGTGCANVKEALDEIYDRLVAGGH